MGKKSVSNEIRQQIITLFKTGNYLNREIARNLRVSPSCVDNAVKRMQETGTPKERPHSGRPSKITPKFRRQLKRAVKKCRESRRKSLRALASQYSEATGSSLCHETVRRSLHSDNIHCYAATHRPTLKAHHKEARLNWCRERSNWEPQRWDTVVWSDESHFTVQPGKEAVRLWREPDEALHPDCIQPQDIGAGGSVTVWGCFAGPSSGVMVVSRGMIDAARYQFILENGLLLSLDLFGFVPGEETWLYQQDNARPHTAATTRAWFEEHQIPLLEWPAKSPDLNPIERLWAFLDRRVRGLDIQNVDQLEDALVRSWN